MKTYSAFKLAPLATAIAASLCSTSIAYAQKNQASGLLEEVVVTSRKRAESVMDIPASIQALTADDLKDMGARGLADYSRFVPSVNVVTYSQGSSVVVFRGANVDSGGYVAQSTSSVYLDEISLSNTGEQPGVRMVDIERVEALAGPQGTLYGSDAQAGTMRIITNKPEMNEFETTVDLSARSGSDSESSYDGSVVVNLPLVEDKLSLRLVGFTALDGGFIDNVFGHTADTDTSGLEYPSGWGTLDNSASVEKGWNESEVNGWRAALRWEINENWAATATALHQEVNGGAANDYDPFVGDLQVVRFNDEYRDDEYDMYSLVVEADLGFAQLVSATSYFEREIFEVRDNTTYNHAVAAAYCHAYSNDPSYFPYYYATPEGEVNFWPVYCMGPTLDSDYLTAYDFGQSQDRLTQEIRLSSQGDTVDWLVGLFYEESNNAFYYDFSYPTANEDNPVPTSGVSLYQDSVSLDFWEFYLGESFPNAKEHWYEDSKTEWKQVAVFGEVVWHVTEDIDLTAGGRYFDRQNDNFFYEEHPRTNTAELDGGLEAHSGEETEFVPKLSISYNVDEDTMIYGLWTEGFRPGGTNRHRGEPLLAKHYEPDKLTNWEAGYKSTFNDGSARVNLTAFYMDWEGYQLEIVDPSWDICPDGGPSSIAGVCGQPWQNSVTNAGDAHILGVSLEVDLALSPQLMIGFNAEWLEAETDDELDLTLDGDPNILSGQQLPITPELTGSAWASYNWPVEAFDANAYVRLQWSYTGTTISNIEKVELSDMNSQPQFENESFNIGDFSIGMQTDDWDISLFVNNLTDERAAYQHSWDRQEYTSASVQDGRAHTSRIYTNRPREVGLRFSKRWGS